jgi:hypothetical protein
VCPATLRVAGLFGAEAPNKVFALRPSAEERIPLFERSLQKAERSEA